MLRIRCFVRPAAFGALVALGTGCVQLDQTLPLEVDSGQSATGSIGAAGGVVSVPPDFALNVPAGALSSSASITVARRLSAPFPADAGLVLPGTSFDVTPAGLQLAAPATAEFGVPATLLGVGDDIRLGVAVLATDGSVVTYTGSYDATSGLLSAEIDQLGPMAAVVELDAIEVLTGLPPTLSGGNFGGTPSGVDGPAGVSSQGNRFTADCSPAGRRCFSSGLVRAWVSDNVAARFGTGLAIVSAEVIGDLDFTSFTSSGQPSTVVGSVVVRGHLKAKIGQTVTSYDVDERRVTGPGATATPTGASIIGNRMVLDRTSEGSNTDIEFELTRIATGELLTIRVEEEVFLDNDDGSTTVGTVILHLRLRR